ncbi:MAG TPA: Stk1 family PASTA domain-containing Ser/Thr kinase [Mycobacteriales bacterium]|nr:Stk1 family PASTA domain-containing Ser/Thr kinase [Mycobacteriales bacterium]
MTAQVLLGGRYALGEVIGRGGMAEVWRGTDTRLDRDVAVKVLRADLARDPAFQARFRREAQSAASLDAPNVVAVYDTGVDEHGVPWIVMEHVEGRTLRQILGAEGRLLPQRALEVAVDVCSALEVAHRAGIVHRDIKPGNVMLTSQGEVKVMDFGIARAASVGDSTMTGTESVIGTAAYLSPEQARGEHVDARSDLYSTGCLLYELLTGSPPFVGDSPVAVAYQHVREAPVPPSRYVEGLAPDIDTIVLTAMAKSPTHRYADADAMREDLLRAAAGQPVEAVPPGELEDLPAALPLLQRDHRPEVVWSVYAAVALVVAILAGLLVHALLGEPNDLIKAPTVVGLSQQDAIRQLSVSSLHVDKVTGVFDAQPVGTVVGQSPDKNFFVRRGGSVDLTVSRGLELTTVPAVIGLPVADASADLSAAKLVVKTTTRDGNHPGGEVLDIVPRPGTQLAARQPVTLVVASGKTRVPDVRGTDQQTAIDTLGASGFAIGIRQQPSDLSPGTVLQQSPVNVLATHGSEVVIDVAYDPAAGSPPPAP